MVIFNVGVNSTTFPKDEMSPFAQKLKEYRELRKLRQNEASIAIGCEQSYLSALENGCKGPPKEDFIKRVIRAYQLTDSEIDELRHAIENSRKRFVLSSKASIDEYEIWNKLEDQAGRLQPRQIALLKIALELGQDNIIY